MDAVTLEVRAKSLRPIRRLQPNGKIVASNDSYCCAADQRRLAIARYLNDVDGNADFTFRDGVDGG